MMPSPRPIPNAVMECLRSSATEALGAKCPMRRPIRPLRAAAAASQRIGRTKQPPKTGGQAIGGRDQCIIANTAAADSHKRAAPLCPIHREFLHRRFLGRLPPERVVSTLRVGVRLT
jgi:hypothetical protein